MINRARVAAQILRARLRRWWYLLRHGLLRGDRVYEVRDAQGRLTELGVVVLYANGKQMHVAFWIRPE